MRTTRPVRLLSALVFVTGSAAASACNPHIEEHAAHLTASFRPHSSAFESCEVSEADYRRVVGEWLRTRAQEGPMITSLFLGRAQAYPWISTYLADAALERLSQPSHRPASRAMARDELATAVLKAPSLLKRLDIPFADTPYRVSSISFEKVLFGRAGQYSSNKDAGTVQVPFDALLSLRLLPRSPT